jgi:four helix bundle protein
MERTNFENLVIYRLAEELADAIREVAIKWERFDRDTIGKQIVRSADSIGANIAEGVGRYGTQDNKRFAYFARGSLYETKHWLRRAFKRELLNEGEIDKIRLLVDELGPKLNAYINSLKPSAAATNNEQRTTNN